METVTKNVRRLAARLLRPALDAQRESFVAEARALFDAHWDRVPDSPWLRQRVDKGTQTLLRLAYQDLVRQGKPLPRLDDVGFRAYSQFDEDGILLYLFTLLGVSHKTSVEICAGTGHECNSANLIINHAWDGLLIDGNPETRAGRARRSTRDIPIPSGARRRSPRRGSTPRRSTT